MTRVIASWCCVLASLLISVPLFSANVLSDGGPSSSGLSGDPLKAAAVQSLPIKPTPLRLPARPQLPAPPQRVAIETATPAPPARAAVPAATPVPQPVPLPAAQPPVAGPGFCSDVLSLNVVDPELLPAVQAGAVLLDEHFGCQKFRIDGRGLPIKFGQVTPLFNARVLAYAHGTPASYEVWINPDCWGVVEEWAGIVAHELGHYLGWSHGDDHPYMWLPPPRGSHARPGDMVIVC